MHRLGHCLDGDWVAYSHRPSFEVSHRVVAGVPGSEPAVFEAMARCLEPPYVLLYVLHTPRGEAPPGRYQSPPLSLVELEGFVQRFAAFLKADGRFDLWVHSSSENATVVWDRHDQIFAYGPVERFSSVLRALGFESGRVELPTPHEHYYRPEFDGDAREVIGAFAWSYSPLAPSDEQ